MRRLTAMIYDGLLVIALIAVVNAVALGIAYQTSDGTLDTLSPTVVRIVTVTAVFGFYCAFWMKGGQTLGMQAWRIQLVSSKNPADGQNTNISFAQGLARCCAASLSAACLGLGYLWCLFDPRRRYWHCHLSNTELILLPKREKAPAS